MAALKGKAVVKIGMQHGKLITGVRLQKPPTQTNSFRSIAGAVRASAVCLFCNIKMS